MDTGMSEEQAAEQVLGISYTEIGIGIARQWNFPERLLEGMQRIAPRDIARPKTEIAKLKVATSLANDLYVTALRTSQADKTAALQALSDGYSAALKIDAKELLATVEQGLKKINDRATTLNLPLAHSPALNVIRVWTGGTEGHQDSEATGETPPDDPLMQDIAIENTQAANIIERIPEWHFTSRALSL